MRHRRTYDIAGSTLVVQFGDILSSSAEVIVSSDDHLLSMGGGVSGAIAKAAGSMIVVDAAKAVPRNLGDVVVTTAGALAARYVFHVVTIGPAAPLGDHLDRDGDDSAPLDVVGRATRRCLELLGPLGLRSIAFPALGGGVAAIPLEDIASGMLRTVIDSMGRASEAIHVELFLQPKRWQHDDDYIVFFEQLARMLPLPDAYDTAPSERRDPDAAERTALDESRDRLLQLERDRNQLERELASADQQPDSIESEELKRKIIDTTWERIGAINDRSPTRVFISYSHDDADLAKRLLQHMAALRLNGLATWTDRQIVPGANWEGEIHSAIDEADIALFLLSPSFLASEYCTGTEWKRARERQATGDLVIIPIILRPSMWQELIGDLQALPVDGLPVVSHSDPDDAFLDIVQRMRVTIENLRAQRDRGAQP